MAELKNEKRVYRSALDGVLRLELLRGLVAVAAEVAAGGAVVLLPRLETHPAEVVLALHARTQNTRGASALACECTQSYAPVKEAVCTFEHFMWLQPSFFWIGDLQFGHGFELVTSQRKFAANSDSEDVLCTKHKNVVKT